MWSAWDSEWGIRVTLEGAHGLFETSLNRVQSTVQGRDAGPESGHNFSARRTQAKELRDKSTAHCQRGKSEVDSEHNPMPALHQCYALAPVRYYCKCAVKCICTG